jgi:hypothetical protein
MKFPRIAILALSGLTGLALAQVPTATPGKTQKHDPAGTRHPAAVVPAKPGIPAKANVPEELKPYLEKVRADQAAIREASKNHDKAGMAAARKQLKEDVRALQSRRSQFPRTPARK